MSYCVSRIAHYLTSYAIDIFSLAIAYFIIPCLFFIIHHSIPVMFYSLLFTHYCLLMTYYPGTIYLSLVAYYLCLLPIVQYLLPIINHWQFLIPYPLSIKSYTCISTHCLLHNVDYWILNCWIAQLLTYFLASSLYYFMN